MISDSTIQKVRDANIEEVLKPYINLARKGVRSFGCCPFHGERTPSLAVSPDKGLWHCFGCHEGGDAISFVQKKENCSFEEAVSAIANNLKIPIEFVAESEEQKAERSHREELFVTVEIVQKFFTACLAEDSQEAAQARQYAANRWGEDFARDYFLGLAPADSRRFLTFVDNYDISKENLLELGILRKDPESGRIYPMFSGRLTIPVRNRTNRIIGFTARKLSEDRKGGKYVNSATSPIFDKSKTLFGINTAVKAARNSDFVIVVEGAPDVLRLQLCGLPQAVATLGTAMTQSHLDELKAITDCLCFIPDSDPPKEPGVIPPGTMAVIRSGTLAVRSGFLVSVREIPSMVDESGERIKQDADSYISSLKDFIDLSEENFIVWLARHRFSGATSMAARAKAVQEIASLLCFMPKTMVDTLFRDLSAFYGTFTLWKRALAEARGLKAREERGEMDQEQLDEKTRPFGFIIRNNCYFYNDENENEVRMSNFILIPKFHIIDPRDGTRIFNIRNNKGKEHQLVLRQSEIENLQAFKVRIKSLGPFMWRAKAEKLDNVMEFCFEETKSAFPVDVMGWSEEHEFYAFGNGIFLDGKFLPVDEMGVVDAGKERFFFIPALSKLFRADKTCYQFERSFLFEEKEVKMSLAEFAAGMRSAFHEPGIIAFCYMLASVFRDICYQHSQTFPILNLFGEKGTGKTTIASCIQTVFGRFRKPASIEAMTIPAINDAMTQAVNYLCVIDEYKNDIHPSKINFLKNIFDGTGQAKKNMDGDKKMFRSYVTASLALCGQDKPTQDMALFSRLIFIHLTRTEFLPEERKEVEAFVERCRPGNTHLLLEILRHREAFVKNFPLHLETVKDELTRKAEGAVNVRVLTSWALILASFRSLEPYLNLPFSYADAFEVAIAYMTKQNEDCEQNSEMAEFWNLFQGLYTQGRIIDRAHFRIKYHMKFSTGSKREELDFGRPHPVLYLNPAAVSTLFSGGKGIGSTANRSSWPTLLSYLKGQPYYLGLKQDRFYILRANGELDFEWSGSGPGAKKNFRAIRPKALCFDYEMLRNRYGLSLESGFEDDADDESDDFSPQALPTAPADECPGLFPEMQ